METQPNYKLIAKVLAVGLIIAGLSYLFHPEAGQLSLMVNGKPVAEPIIRFAAVPTFLVITAFTAMLMLMLFFGIGLLMFLGALTLGLAMCFMLAPYFWPVLLIIFLIIAIMSLSHDQDHS